MWLYHARTKRKVDKSGEIRAKSPDDAERPIVGKGGPLKSMLRRLMRWYVEPGFADQRAFNDAVLKLIDDLDERIARLEARP